MSEDRRETVEAREREAFEKWYSDYGAYPRAVERGPNGFYRLAAGAAWNVWQARAALEGQQSPEPRHIRRLGDPDADAAIVAKMAGQSQSERAEPSIANRYIAEQIAKEMKPLYEAFASPQSSIGAGEQKEKPMKVTDEMVSRFLTWRLPDDFGPDCGITFAKFQPNGTTRYEPVGTNLLTAPQARQMLEHVLAVVGASTQAEEALRRLHDWGGFLGYSGGKWCGTIVCDVMDWFVGGMKGPLPPLPEWAEEEGKHG